MLVLRDMLESDIEDYVRWFTKETEWCRWDAPWEQEESDEETERRSWTEYYEAVRKRPADRFRWKFEIEADGIHIGWVSAYTDLGYIENPEEFPAIGIDIPEIKYRSKGLGTQALKMFIDYLHEHGINSCYTQTWSGNLPMMRTAQKLGFREVCRKVGLREVNGEKYDAVTFQLDMDKLTTE